MLKIGVICMGCNLYLDNSENECVTEELAKETGAEIRRCVHEAHDRPDWYFKAQAQHVLGLS